VIVLAEKATLSKSSAEEKSEKDCMIPPSKILQTALKAFNAEAKRVHDDGRDEMKGRGAPDSCATKENHG
jgi:hypothetical protein